MKEKKEVKERKEEIDKNKKMILKLLNKNLEGFLLDEIFEEKCKELNERISFLERKLCSLNNVKDFDEEKPRNYFFRLKNDSNHSLNRKLIESFLYEVIIYKDRIEVVFRRFPKGTLDYLDLENMVKDGGSRGSIFKWYQIHRLFYVSIFLSVYCLLKYYLGYSQLLLLFAA